MKKLLLIICFLFLTTGCSAKTTETSKSETKPLTSFSKNKKNQWDRSNQNYRIVNRYSTFLFKDRESDPLKEKLLEQAKMGLPYDLQRNETDLFFENDMLNTELLYGDVVKVLEDRGDYTKVAATQQTTINEPDGYTGWVFTSDLSEIPKSFRDADQQVILTKELISDQDKLSAATFLPLISESSMS